MTRKPHTKPAILSLLEDIEHRESMNPEFYYSAKEPSIRFLQKRGMKDAAIERFLGLVLKEEHRSS